MNSNMLNTPSFRLVINTTDFEYTQFNCTAVNIPSITTTPIEQRFRQFQGPISGDSLSFGELSIDFLVDEELKAYKELFNWQMNNWLTDDLKYYDISLHLLSNHHMINQTLEFKGAVISSLGSIDMSTKSRADGPVSCTAGFAYSRFNFL